MKIQVDISKQISKALEVHKLRYNLHDKREALVDVLQRFFENDRFDYFLQENLKIEKNKPKKKSGKDYADIMNQKERGK